MAIPSAMSAREKAEKAARLKSRGWENAAIAGHLQISERTVRRYLAKVGTIDAQSEPGQTTTRATPSVSSAVNTFDPSRQGDPNAALAAQGVAVPVDPLPSAHAVEIQTSPASEFEPPPAQDPGPVASARAGLAALGFAEPSSSAPEELDLDDGLVGGGEPSLPAEAPIEEPEPIPAAAAGTFDDDLADLDDDFAPDFSDTRCKVVYLTTPQVIALIREAWESGWYVRWNPTEEQRATVPMAGIAGPYRSKEKAVARARKMGFGFVDQAKPELKRAMSSVEDADIETVQREVAALESRYELTVDDEVMLEVLTDLVRDEPLDPMLKGLVTRVHHQVAVIVRDAMRRDNLTTPELLSTHAGDYTKRAFLEIKIREAGRDAEKMAY